MSADDPEKNRMSERARRYVRVGAGVGQASARIAGARLIGQSSRASEAALLRAALGNLRGPIVKVAQLLATIPDLLPPEYTAELQKLQAHAPAMGWAFVKRRMQAELGPDWRTKFADFTHEPSAAASLGQVHRATAHDRTALAVKLQYPDMQSAVEADLKQLDFVFSLHARFDRAIDTSQMRGEIAARIREELDYRREARHLLLYRHILRHEHLVRVPDLRPELSTGRLLSMTWVDGDPLLDYREASQQDRNLLATALFRAWWHPFSQFAVIHGDPHLGNYTVRSDQGEAQGINLLDFGCVRIFPPRFVSGVIDLYEGLRDSRPDQVVHAYDIWGFKNLSKELIDTLNIWARFIYGPMLEDRVRTIADGVAPSEYGRRQAFQVHKALKERGPVTVPREFVFMDRAAIGLGSVFLHLRAELNFYRLFNDTIANHVEDDLAARQSQALTAVGLEPAPA
ncbi:MAG: AarF/ABC1/UbiB kinase family protein [Hyphomicrobiales bacterium]|nr:AarF/ABC1/UbiB kinase family protein [Hyphomicrobiales bacterium]OQW82988.1 MAG: ABC transporter ATP-binding protein [Proteobacteria bacterium ST_bin15]